MIAINRRRLLLGMVSSAAGLTSLLTIMARLDALAQNKINTAEMEQWMDQWMSGARIPEGALHLSRFKEPVYFLIKPIAWKPNQDQASSFQEVHVPIGFVTDFASIPRIFWSLLRPDGVYTYPAILHDYLYWTQTRARSVCDQIFRFAMQDFDIDSGTATLIYNAVRAGGVSAWKENARLKAAGEKKVLKQFPDDPRVSWLDWKKRPGVFVP